MSHYTHYTEYSREPPRQEILDGRQEQWQQFQSQQYWNYANFSYQHQTNSQQTDTYRTQFYPEYHNQNHQSSQNPANYQNHQNTLNLQSHYHNNAQRSIGRHVPHNQNNWPHTYQQNMIRAEIQKKHYFQEHQRQVEMFGMQEPSMEQAHARSRYAATNAQDPTDPSDQTSIQLNMMVQQASTPRLGYNSLPLFSATRAFPNSEVWYRLGQRTSMEASLQNTSTLTNCLITSQKIADQTTPSSLDESSRFSPASSSSIAALMSPTAPASVHESRARHVSTVSTSPKTFTLLSASSGNDMPKHKKTREQTSPTLPKSSSSTLSDITSIDSFAPISEGSPLSDPLLDSKSPERLVEIVRSRKRKKEEKTHCCLVAPITNNTRKHGTPYRPRLDKASRANLLKFIKPDDVHLRRKDFVVKVWERQKRAGVEQSPEYQIGNIFITKRRELLRSTDDHE